MIMCAQTAAPQAISKYTRIGILNSLSAQTTQSVEKRIDPWGWSLLYVIPMLLLLNQECA